MVKSCMQRISFKEWHVQGRDRTATRGRTPRGKYGQFLTRLARNYTEVSVHSSAEQQLNV